MRGYLISIVMGLMILNIYAQRVTNVTVTQEGQKLRIQYELSSSSPTEVGLYISENNGSTWSKVTQHLSGDVGSNVSAGNKQMVWDVLQARENLVGNAIVFKVKVESDRISDAATNENRRIEEKAYKKAARVRNRPIDNPYLAVKLTPIAFLKNQFFTANLEVGIPRSNQTLSLAYAPNILPEIGDIVDSYNLNELVKSNENGWYTYSLINSDAYNVSWRSGNAFDAEWRFYIDERFKGPFIGAYSSFRFSKGVKVVERIEEFSEWSGYDYTNTGGFLESNSKVKVYGVQFGISKVMKNKKFAIDYYFGLGLKNRNIQWQAHDLLGPGIENEKYTGLATRGNFSLSYIFR